MKKEYTTPETFVFQMMHECIMDTDSTGHNDGQEALSKEYGGFFDEEEETVLAKPHTLWDDDENEEEEW